MSYEQQFTQGIQNRVNFDPRFTFDQSAKELLEETFRNTSRKALEEPFFSIRQRICSEAAHYARAGTVTPFSYQCLADSHTFLTACIEQKLVNKTYMTLTIGDVSVEGERLFNTKQATLEECVRDGISTVDQPRFHVWLTLADMTVIDLTIISQLLVKGCVPPPENNEQWLTVWRPERQGRFNYHPLLIDDEFLSRLQRPVN